MHMKKVLIVFFIVVIAFTVCVYIFIPSKLNVSAVEAMAAPANGVYRCVSSESSWNKWLDKSAGLLPKKVIVTSSFMNVVNVLILDKNDSIKTTMELLSLKSDSTIVQWKFSAATALNPVTRILKYNQAVEIKKDMDSMLHQLKLFVSKDENIYGFTAHEASTKDTILISTKINLTHYPSTKDIYDLIDKVKNYAAKSSAQITNYPMYNVTKIEGDTIRLMVAIPVNKAVKQAGSISPVRMVPGRFLVAQVTGGNATVQNAFNQMQLYFSEHNRTAMAIPFAYLITDRREEADTAKWITKIYAPVY
jgi:hypothetical protein